MCACNRAGEAVTGQVDNAHESVVTIVPGRRATTLLHDLRAYRDLYSLSFVGISEPATRKPFWAWVGP